MSTEDSPGAPEEATAAQAESLPAQRPAGEELASVVEENERLKAELERRESRGHALATTRRIVVGALVVLSCLSVVLAGVAWWTHQTLLNTDSFMKIATPLAEKPEIQQAVAVYTTDAIFNNLNIQARITDALPDKAQVLSAPITKAVRDFTESRLLAFTQTQTFQDLWTQSFQLAHQGAVRVLRDEAPNVSVVNGDVRLNLLPVIATGLERVAEGAAGLFNANVNVDLATRPGVQDPQVLRQKLETRFGVTLPETFGTVRLMGADQLASLQSAVKLFDRLVYALFALTIVLIVLALVLSRRRRRTLVQLGVGVVISLLVLRVVTQRLQAMVIDSIADPTGRGAARVGVQTVLDNIRAVGNLILVFGLLLAIVAYLLGRPRWLMVSFAWVRRITASQPGGSALERFVAGRYDWLRLLGLVVAVLVLLWVGIGWLSVLLLAAFVAAWLIGLRVLHDRALPADGRGELPPGATPTLEDPETEVPTAEVPSG